MRATILGACVGVALLASLPACGPPPVQRRIVDRVVPGGIVETDNGIRFVAVWRGPGGADDRTYVVTCPTRGGSIESSGCSWQYAGNHRELPAESGRIHVARAMASAEHRCAFDDVTMQSNGTREGVEGFWLLVCGTQRFYQWAEQEGRFVERSIDRE